MSNYQNGLKVLLTSLTLAGIYMAQIQASSPGNMEAINSASAERRNIVGIEVSNITPEQRQALGYTGDGVYVSAVIPGHPAAVAGIKVNDIITRIGNWEVTNLSAAMENMDSLEAGIKHHFEIHRLGNDGKFHKITLSVLVEKVQERAIAKIS